ncbi:MAG: Trk system potassium uptake protein [Alphaproteobacteria bacterium]|nr:MAG: Trk system potassium uptake protein [Alphaproteobacteria bacterium]
MRRAGGSAVRRRARSLKRGCDSGMQFETILSPLGLLLCVAGLGMLVPALVDIAADNPDWQVFLASSFLSGGTGAFLYLGFRDRPGKWRRREGFLFVSASWIVLSVAASLPFMLTGIELSAADAFFEAVSGLTTTGSTVLTGLDNMPPGILMWRSILQWTGGVGIVVLSVFLFPFLKLGGQHLFALESSDTAEKSFARFEEYATRIILLYLGLTVACMVLYDVLGMSSFDAINHAMTTVSTGGYSTSDLSMGKFHSLPILWVSIVFMWLGAMPFMVLLFLFSARRRYFDVQIVYFFAVILVAVVVVVAALRLRNDPINFATLTSVIFTVTAIITTTGYAYQDYGGWPAPAILAIFLVTLLGGCSGSTSGGLKMFRIVVLVEMCRAAFRRLLWPSAVRSMRYGRQTIDEDVTIAVATFVLLYSATLVFGAVVLAISGQDLITSVSASATAIANVGPGLGPTVGPAFNFAGLSDFQKMVLSIQMLLGRLEIMSVLILLAPAFWRQ